MVNKDRVKQLFLELIKINGPSRQEREVADYLKAKLSELGLDVEEDDAGSKIGGNAGNVIAFLKGNTANATPIFLSCHMDTVEPTDKLNVVIKDGVISSDGTTILGGDDRAGIAAVIEGLHSIIENNEPHGDIQILFSVSEEVGLCGAREISPDKIRGKMGYVLDTEKPVAGITLSAPSHETLKIEITGTAAHAGIAPEKGVSAIVAASNAISKMKLGRIDEETTANIGIIQGGKARNIVPDYVLIRAEARSRNKEKLAAQVEHMKMLFEEEAVKIGAKAEVETIGEYATYRWTPEDEVVKLAAKASGSIGVEPFYEEGGGGSDANIFNAAGIPAVVVGAGYQNAHSTSECIAIDDLIAASEFAVSLIRAAANTEG